jgi:hypothetical protein
VGEVRYARKVDLAQPAIVAALEAVGCRVLDLSWVGRGVPDLHVVCPRRRLYWMEVKNPRPANSKAKDDRTDAEIKMATVIPIHVVRTPADALAVVGIQVAA